MGESVNILVLDTFVAVFAGLIIFPACFTYDVQTEAGPSLLFVAMAKVFNNMRGGRWWGLNQQVRIPALRPPRMSDVKLSPTMMVRARSRWGSAAKQCSFPQLRIHPALFGGFSVFCKTICHKGQGEQKDRTHNIPDCQKCERPDMIHTRALGNKGGSPDKGSKY